MGLQTDFLSFSFSFSSSTPLTFVFLLGTENAMGGGGGGGGYCTVDHGSCTEYVLLFTIPIMAYT